MRSVRRTLLVVEKKLIPVKVKRFGPHGQERYEKRAIPRERGRYAHMRKPVIRVCRRSDRGTERCGGKLCAEVARVGGGGGDGGGGEVVMTTAATNHPEVTQREITLHPIRFKAGTGLAIPRRKSPP